MAATKLTKLEREQRLQVVAQMHNQGYNMRRIAEHFGDPDHTQVAYDLKVLKKRYQTLQQLAVTAHREEISDQYRAIFEEMWEAYRDSKTKKVIADEKVQDGTTVISTPTVLEVPVNPDVRFMQVATECLEAFRKLRGADLDKGASPIINNQQVIQVDWEPASSQGVTEIDSKLEELEQLPDSGVPLKGVPDKPQIGLKEIPKGNGQAD
jgi:hypothetical protein